MTKSIDPRYVLDEVEILGLLVERIAEHTGLLRFGESIHGVRLHTERSARHTAALFQELRDRRDTRARLAGQGPRMARSMVDAIDPFEYMEQLLDTLRVLPTPEAMRTILTSHKIEKLAEEMRIDQQLIHTAVAAGPRGVNLGDVYRKQVEVLAQMKGKTVDELTPEEREEWLIDSWAPYLPEPIRSQWQQAVDTTNNEISGLGVDELIKAYETYLQWVLDSYAVGTNKGSFHVASYNERDRSGTSPIPAYKDTFWHRKAAIRVNPEYDPSRPWHAASRTVKNEPVNAPYIIEIEFEPRGIRDTDFVISLWDTRTGTPPAHIQELIGEVKEGYHFVVVESRGMHGEDPLRAAVGRTKLEAYTILVVGEPENTSVARRTMTEAEQEELRKAASDPSLQIDMSLSPTVPQHDLPPPRGATEEAIRNTLTGDVFIEMEKLSIAELEGLLDALVAHAKYGVVEKHEFVAREHFKPVPKYSIRVESTEPDKMIGKHIKANWVFTHEGLWRERCRMLAGLCALRGVFLEKSDQDTETHAHYTMPYTIDELHTIFGPYEELT